MSIHEIEAEALKLSEAEREELAERLLATVRRTRGIPEDDPIRLLGSDPVDTGDTDASVAHDQYIYGRAGS
jgi:hypothetical protein